MQICKFTNEYAQQHGPNKPYFFKNWQEVTPEELYTFFGLLMYMSIIQAPNIELYWSVLQLFHGLWARAFMSRFRYKQIQCFIKFSNPATERREDKLTKVRFVHDFLRAKCMKYWQPNEQISIDERMVRNKGRYSFRQYIKDKPTKWGMKVWVLADSITGYTYNFLVYTGKSGDRDRHANGLGYEVVMSLSKQLLNQGYKLFTDNFYTSVKLFEDLLQNKTSACGTILLNRKGIPASLKNVNYFKKSGKQRGKMRYLREKNLGFVQWQDNKIVSILTTMHKNLSNKVLCKRRSKVNGNFRELNVAQPLVIKDYNTFMGGVDRSDQMIGKYNVLRKTSKYWKTLMYHFLDIARVNAFIMFNQFRKLNPDIPEVQRKSRYSQLDFTVELIKELGDLNPHVKVPLYERKKKNGGADHIVVPITFPKSYNCNRCYRLEHVERRSRFKCRTCDLHFCFNQHRNCLLDEHPLSDV